MPMSQNILGIRAALCGVLLGVCACGDGQNSGEVTPRLPFKYATNTAGGVTYACTGTPDNPRPHPVSPYGAQLMATYDAYFEARRPKSDADFNWQEKPALLSMDILNRVKFNGGDNAGGLNFNDLFDFDPGRYTRGTGKNFDIFQGNDGSKNWPFMHYNPRDYVPTTATHYARSTTNDVMAVQFYFQWACRGMTPDACPDCVDGIVPLSCNDAQQHRILEVRFVRPNGGSFLVSKPFKMLSVDCAGHDYFTEGAIYQFSASPSVMTDRRVEISGWFARTLDRYMKPTPILLRFADGPSPGEEPPPAPVTTPAPVVPEPVAQPQPPVPGSGGTGTDATSPGGGGPIVLSTEGLEVPAASQNTGATPVPAAPAVDNSETAVLPPAQQVASAQPSAPLTNSGSDAVLPSQQPVAPQAGCGFIRGENGASGRLRAIFLLGCCWGLVMSRRILARSNPRRAVGRSL